MRSSGEILVEVNEKMPEKETNHRIEDERRRELRVFDESKAGVKGLVDAGVHKVPRIFNCEGFGFNLQNPGFDQSDLSIPVIDLEGIGTNPDRRTEIVRAVRDASSMWGFFQITNHGIPSNLLDEMIQGVRGFHELDSDVKREFYSRDRSKKVVYFSNFDLYEAPVTNWRDTLGCTMAPEPPNREQLPEVCRDIMIEYSNQVKQLGLVIFELLSEALGLEPSYFKDKDYVESLLILGHYYPPCPEPELTIGTTSHSDNDFLTILLQDNIGGLQVLHEDKWVDVAPLPGALIVNLGDLLQLASNDKFASANHRVLSKREGPRVSIASFFRAHLVGEKWFRIYGPIPELISEDNPPVYRNVTLKEYMEHYFGKGLDGTSALTLFKV